MGISDILFKRKEALAQKNLEEANAFLANNKNKEGVITTPSGLQYEVLTASDGRKPQAINKVECHYEGRLLDGKIFDSSYARKQSATFPLGAVIKGWTEGLQYMSIDSKFRFYIHPDLGYGKQQVGSHIGPNSLLIFDVELLAIL